MKLEEAAAELARCGREFYKRGWVLGTSGNFSALLSREPIRLCITASGNDKGRLDSRFFLEVDKDSEVVSGNGNPSAETILHLGIYQQKPEARSVMHTHSVWGTILSDLCVENGAIEIEGYEMLKGLSGIKTHEHKESIPVIENSQDYAALSHVVENTLRENPSAHGIYLRRHGLYTWGTDIEEAKRHIEILEFLFEVVCRKETGDRSQETVNRSRETEVEL